jgi:hypothetical protein
MDSSIIYHNREHYAGQGIPIILPNAKQKNAGRSKLESEFNVSKVQTNKKAEKTAAPSAI